MAKVKVHAGDFRSGAAHFGSFILPSAKQMWPGETIAFAELAELEIASEESVKRIEIVHGGGSYERAARNAVRQYASNADIIASHIVVVKKKAICLLANQVPHRKAS
ncbi:hypothetical protein EOC93_08695 [Mesorhizobium sp. M6A.T.Ce.TU.002.03.1.1]|uniref:hypothetical protein n=1 Tax=Mesorhizobium sp. M6A.T.Ce.TU.002.03.1.1 TaxID=2496782 RepID=UPI000FCC60CE|nr:hypothetical protein [Mesorhizobium sp. M6A.T.Ce.TU.002.03.1.1]RUU44999.1 hypothetical protein EOC93_08695 [Mesorhizobium sp. M6A.T.Ce.TU.002.03.1.1]